MPRRTVFASQDVVRAACRLVAERGLRGLSARGVARQLHSSTAPVYSNFATMAELERAVIREVIGMLYRYATTPYTENAFLNMGVGITFFARDHSNLFRAVFMEGNAYKDLIAELRVALLPEMDRDGSLAALSTSAKRSLLNKMSIFTHGLAAQICVGLSDRTDDEAIIGMLREVGAAVIGDAVAAAQAPGESDEAVAGKGLT